MLEATIEIQMLHILSNSAKLHECDEKQITVMQFRYQRILLAVNLNLN